MDWINKENLLYRLLPQLVLETARRYFRLEVEGLENLPRRGAALVTPNHSGYSGFDAALLAHVIHKDHRRVPRILAHHLWFFSKLTAVPAQKMGFTEASFENGLRELQKNNLVVIFPEGENGNFKPSTQMYHLQSFRTGFVRMAISTQCPIVPTLIIGAEETHLNLTQLRLARFLPPLPIPLNLIPLPVRWKMKFLPPIFLPYKPEAASDRDLLLEIADELREQMQDALSEEILKR